MFWKITTLMCLAGMAGYIFYPTISERLSPQMSTRERLCQTMSEVDKDALVGLLSDNIVPEIPEICKEYSYYWK